MGGTGWRELYSVIIFVAVYVAVVPKVGMRVLVLGPG